MLRYFNQDGQELARLSVTSTTGGMVLYLVGLGLGDEKDITVKGLEAVRRCSKVYLEHYTSILGVDKERLVRRKFAGDSKINSQRGV